MQYSNTENYSSTIRDSPSKWNGKEDKGYVYKKSSYQYASSGNSNPKYTDKSVDSNIDQLDALLEDLKHERQITRDKDILSTTSNYRTIERDNVDPSGIITKSTRIVKTTKQLEPTQIFDDVGTYGTTKSIHRTLFTDNSPTNEKIYASGLPGSIYESRNKIYESNRTLQNTELVPATATSTTTSTHLEKDLQNITLSDDILPVPGTKVTTTVRTYTYEIPPNTSINNNSLQHNVNYNTIQRNELREGYLPNVPPSTHVPPTVVYNTESYSTINKNSERPPVVSNQIYEIREHKETNSVRDNLPTQPHNPPQPSSTTKTVIYNVNTTENIHGGQDSNILPHSPIHSGPHNLPQSNKPSYGVPSTNKYYYKESTNTINTIHGPGGATNEPHSPYKPLQTGYPPFSAVEYPPHPNESTVTYKYSSSTMNSRRGPEYGTPSPNIPPAPFPVDGVEFPVTNGNPPQRVDDLMQSFDDADATDKTNIHTPHRKREIETAVATPNQQNVPTVNRVGKEVYYPPGHEMMLMKREEMAAGSASGGRWAKGSGMYEYESGYKSKTKTKSGGAVVPCCLPLCCAMPCTIM